MPIHMVPPGIFKTAIGNTTRNASGAQSITGLGFKPKVLIIFGRSTGGVNQIYSVGYADGTSHWALYMTGDSVDVLTSSTVIIQCRKDASNLIYAVLTSLDADGFTLTWTLTGTITATWGYLAIA